MANSHTQRSLDYATWVSAHYELARAGAARSAMIAARVGSLEPGKQADIILLDRYDWGFLPLHDPIQQITFSVNSEAVQTAIIRRRVVTGNRKLTLVDDLRARISEAAERFRRDERRGADRPALSRSDVRQGHRP